MLKQTIKCNQIYPGFIWCFINEYSLNSGKNSGIVLKWKDNFDGTCGFSFYSFISKKIEEYNNFYIHGDFLVVRENGFCSPAKFLFENCGKEQVK